jgi:two-component system sensor histidine kinase KdpD
MAACERVLVEFDHRLHSRRVIRDAWWLAHSRHADLLAVSVSIQPEVYHSFTSNLLGLLRYGRNAHSQREAASHVHLPR